MTEPQMRRLVENIRRDGALTSTPLCYLHEDASLEVLSGNHRVEGAIMAELAEIDVMVVLDQLPLERRVAIQLAHNSITGQDDPNILLRLYDFLPLTEKLYSGINDDMLKMLPEIDIDGMSIGQPKTQEIRLLFLDEEEKPFLEFVAGLKDRQKLPLTLCGRMDTFDRLFDTIVAVKRKDNIRNTAVALDRMVQLASERLDQLEAEADD